MPYTLNNGRDPRFLALVLGLIFAAFILVTTNGCENRPTVEEATTESGEVSEEGEVTPSTSIEESDEELPGQPDLDSGSLK